MSLHSHILSEKTRLEKQRDALRQKLKNAPEGNLNRCRENNHVKYYIRMPSTASDSVRQCAKRRRKKDTRRYLNKTQATLKQQLAAKVIWNTRLREIQNELGAIDAFLAAYREVPDGEAALFANAPDIPALAEGLVTSRSAQQKLWMEEPFETNQNHPENRVHKGPRGILFRSKSEVLIAMELERRGYAWRYECPLAINGITYYPDFTILHPVTGKIYYLEHCGMMDDENYYRSFQSKMRSYRSNGILLGVNLLLTFEYAQQAFDPDFLTMQLDYYFG